MRSLRTVGPAWFFAALACFAAGVFASAFGARAVLHNDAANAERAFARTTKSLAATLDVAIRHQEQLTVSASTFYGERPHATPAEFARWKGWARTYTRYPELDALGFLGPAQISPALALSRDTATSVYSMVRSSRGPALAIEAPVYRGAVTPRSVFGRRAASVGWLREVLIPGVVLREALAGQSGYAASLRYSGPGSVGPGGVGPGGVGPGGVGPVSVGPTGITGAALIYASGTPATQAQDMNVPLRGGWSMTSYGPPPPAGVFADPGALALLIGGVIASVLLAVTVLLLGGEGTPVKALVQEPAVPGPAASGANAAMAEKGPREELYDQLTGLPNRLLMLDRAERLIARTGRQSEAVSGALFVEVDWVGEVNDRLGREAGDRLLQIVAGRLEQVVRVGDSVGRLGGDEFVILVESAARGVRLDSLARRVIEALREPVELPGFGPSFVLSTSIGIAFGRYETPAELLADAETAARAAGKDRYKLFNANTRASTDGHELLESELNAAMDDRQLFLLYEPICDLAERRVVGLQALIRWRHPERGVLEATDFMPLARETGLIVPLGRWQLEQACTDAAAWNVAGHRASVSVRVSAEQLNRVGFATDVRRALQLSGLEPSLLTLDVSEATVMTDLAPGAAHLHELDGLGVGIALDDFGSRYASRTDLEQLPLDSLKVNRTSFASTETEEYRRWLLEATLLTGRDLNLPVVVRGVDTLEQLAALRTMGAPLVQGSMLGQPATVDSVEVPLGAAPPEETSPAAPEEASASPSDEAPPHPSNGASPPQPKEAPPPVPAQ